MENGKNIYVQKRLASLVRFQAQKHENYKNSKNDV